MKAQIFHVFLLFVGCCILPSCGFHPLYSPDLEQINQIFISPIKGREGQILRNSLQSSFYSGAKTVQTLYKLDLTLEKNQDELGFRRDETSRRTRLTLVARYTLTDRRTQKVLLSQTASVLTGYSVGSSSSFASLPLIVSEKDAVKRALVQLSHDIHISVSSFLRSMISLNGIKKEPAARETDET